jgi:hypothetical protein
MINKTQHYNSMTVAEINFDTHAVGDTTTKITQNNITVMVTTFINILK